MKALAARCIQKKRQSRKRCRHEGEAPISRKKVVHYMLPKVSWRELWCEPPDLRKAKRNLLGISLFRRYQYKCRKSSFTPASNAKMLYLLQSTLAEISEIKIASTQYIKSAFYLSIMSPQKWSHKWKISRRAVMTNKWDGELWGL